jgi:hypothetical protein
MMIEQGRPLKNQISGASSSRMPPEIPPIPRAAVAPSSAPHAHGLLVALVSAAETPSARLPNPTWPLWLVPRVSRRGNRSVPRTMPPSRGE